MSYMTLVLFFEVWYNKGDVLINSYSTFLLVINAYSKDANLIRDVMRINNAKLLDLEIRWNMENPLGNRKPSTLLRNLSDYQKRFFG